MFHVKHYILLFNSRVLYHRIFIVHSQRKESGIHIPVSYTHLDVYKRQAKRNPEIIGGQVHGICVAPYNGQIPVYSAKYWIKHAIDVYKRQSVNNAKRSTNASENHEQFYALKKQIDAVDDELDKLDDEFEYAYQMKEISFETYKARERAIEKLEDELELAEEALENKYDIDD